MTHSSPSTTTSDPVLTGNSDARIWGMTSGERVRRLIAQETAKRPVAEGHVLHINLDYAFDPSLLRLALKMPGTAFIHGEDMVLGQWQDSPSQTIDLSTNPSFYNEQLRKKETPFAMRLTPQTRYQIERASYFGAYKGVTDLLTKYLWPELAFHITRLAAALMAGESPYDFAERAGLSRHTVRNQMRALQHKLLVRNQAGLIRKLQRLAAPFRADPN